MRRGRRLRHPVDVVDVGPGHLAEPVDDRGGDGRTAAPYLPEGREVSPRNVRVVGHRDEDRDGAHRERRPPALGEAQRLFDVEEALRLTERWRATFTVGALTEIGRAHV